MANRFFTPAQSAAVSIVGLLTFTNNAMVYGTKKDKEELLKLVNSSGLRDDPVLPLVHQLIDKLYDKD